MLRQKWISLDISEKQRIIALTTRSKNESCSRLDNLSVNPRDVLFAVVYHVLILGGGSQVPNLKDPASTIVQKAHFDAQHGNYPIEGIKLVMESVFAHEYLILPDKYKLFYKNARGILCDSIPNTPRVLFVVSPIMSIVHLATMFNSRRYTIETAIIIVEFSTMESTHAICGFFCDGDQWLYDSNGIVVKTDWVKNEYNSYIQAVHKQFGHVISTMQIDVIVYTYPASQQGGRRVKFGQSGRHMRMPHTAKTA